MLNRKISSKPENQSNSKMLPVMEIVLPQLASNVPAFLGKLWKMVDDPDTDYLISWSDEGNSFIIHNQAEFAQALLPYYYKHSNMASFVRQLNMYGFHKVVGVDSGGLKSERQEEMEFAHPCFLRGNEQLLDQIRRKVANKQQPTQTSYVPSIRQEKVNEVLNEVSQLKDKQEDMDTKLETMKKENEALWREVVSLRQKHVSQQKIVNKLIQFLMSVVQPRMGNAVKRRFQPQLAIEDSAGQGGSSPAKQVRKSDGSVVGPSSSDLNNVLTFGAGPVIQDVTHDDDGSHMFLTSSDDDGSLSTQPTVEAPMSPLSAAVMQAVDPLLVSPGVTVAPGMSGGGIVNNRSQPAPKMTNTNNGNNYGVNNSSNGNSPGKVSLSTAMMAQSRRPLLQREISKEDFDLETTLMQKDLDNLKEMLSGQITFDTNILSNLFSPDEPLASYFASNSSTDLMNQKLPLGLETTSDATGGLDQPTLFELADIDDDDNFTNPVTSKSNHETVAELIDLDDDFSASLNTPLVNFDNGDESPLLSQIKSSLGAGRKFNRK